MLPALSAPPMKLRLLPHHVAGLLLACHVAGYPASALADGNSATVTSVHPPVKDTTIYQESSNANALGNSLFTGNTANGNARRALIKFDLSSIPAGSTINSASLTLMINRTTTGPSVVTIHRLTRDWGATTSQASGGEGSGGLPGPGDATWLTTAWQQGPNWSTPGGDFLPNTAPPIGAGAVNTPAVFSGLAGEVQLFVNQPASNFGWLLKGDEVADVSAKRYASSENPGAGPRLTVTYTPPPTNRQRWEQLYFPPGQLIDPNADPDHDGAGNLLEYAWDRSPLEPAPFNDAWHAARDGDWLVIKFWRDPRAVDLIYALETGDDLSAWNAVATSTNGGPPVGPAFLSETDVPGKAPLKEVTARLPAGLPRQLVRLLVRRP